MAKGKARSSEWEFQGEVLVWLNEEIQRRPGLELDKATQEPSKLTPKRNDLVVWRNRAAEEAFLTIELKTPTTSLSDPNFLSDADFKAKRWGAPYFAIWNMQAAELYRTPPPGVSATPGNRVMEWQADPLVKRVDDWLKSGPATSLKERILQILDRAWNIEVTEGAERFSPEASIFVDRLAHWVSLLREEIQPALEHRVSGNRALRRELHAKAAAEGFIGFVEDVNAAIAGQYAYRLIGQVLFYFALRRKQPLRPLQVSPSDSIPEALRPFWDDVRRFDYEALYQQTRIDEIVPVPPRAQAIVRSLINDLAAYDWNKLRDDVLGSIFERLIPQDTQHLLGQFYTDARVADMLLAFSVEGEDAVVLDPGCGSGTFLMRAYDLLRFQTEKSHADLLSQLWGFDISPFAAELAAINLFRQDMATFDNFPRVVPRDFFDRRTGERIPFLPAKSGGQGMVELTVPAFSAIVGNPPYLRSQNQDDLDPNYKGKLFRTAKENGIRAPSKTDLFAFFIYKALEFMRPGSRVGFVTSASWLTSDYGASLQWLLLNKLRLVAVIASQAESFFAQVDVNTVLLVAEMRSNERPEGDEKLRFVTLKRTLEELFPSKQEYWPSLLAFADRIEDAEGSFEDDLLRVKVVTALGEWSALSEDARVARNWSVFLRAPLSYYELFGEPQ